MSTAAWALALLLLTNAGWSWWFSQHLAETYRRQLTEDIIAYPSDPFGRLAANDEYEITYIQAGLTARDYPWLTRFDTITGPRRISRAEREGFADLFQLKPFAAPRWVKPERLKGVDQLADGEYLVEMFTGVGWPLRLLYCRWKRTALDQIVDRRTAVDLGASAQFAEISDVLPYRPIWIGQLAWGSFWFAVVTLVQLMWYILRRGWRDVRRWRGRCANCNYDLRGNTSGACPECGVSVPSRG